MKSKLPFLALCLAGLVLRVFGTAPTELSPELGYLRVHSIVLEREQITAALSQPRALVLDLRYPLDERDAGETLQLALAGAAGRARLYVLVSPVTPVPLVGAIAANPTKVITLGIKGSRPEPQVAIQQTPLDDRRAFDALTAGTSLPELISGKIDKERFDEASLVHEFKNGTADDRSPSSSAVQPNGPAGSTPAPAPDTPERLTDRVLQRALHLHRALQALKR